MQSSRTCSAWWVQTCRTGSRHKACLDARHRSHAKTWNNFKTPRPDHRSGSSHRNRGKLSRHPSLSVSTIAHLCASSSSPFCVSLKCWQRKNRPSSQSEDSSGCFYLLFCAICNPSLSWGLPVSLFLDLLAFPLHRNKAAVEEVAHPRGWKLVSRPTLKAVFTQNIVSMPKHVKGSYL